VAIDMHRARPVLTWSSFHRGMSPTTSSSRCPVYAAKRS